jgi:hypothetical protein
MSWTRFERRAKEPAEEEALDPALKQALGDFKASVHAWGDAMAKRPRTTREIIVRKSWQLAASWSLASLLLAGTLSAGLYEHHHAKVVSELAAQRAAEQQREMAAQRAQQTAQQEEQMLASVDSDVSREVPSAMEPLEQLSDEGSASSAQ